MNFAHILGCKNHPSSQEAPEQAKGTFIHLRINLASLSLSLSPSEFISLTQMTLQ